jgi:hypothetical protein
MNRLFCTFLTTVDEAEEFISNNLRANKIHSKAYLLESLDTPEYVLTYNVANDYGFLHTVMVHRKNDYNTIYSINGLNLLIRELNNGILDTKYAINWDDYRNTIILSRENRLSILKTKLIKIIV